jgi:hypothetical protein
MLAIPVHTKFTPFIFSAYIQDLFNEAKGLERDINDEMKKVRHYWRTGTGRTEQVLQLALPSCERSYSKMGDTEDEIRFRVGSGEFSITVVLKIFVPPGSLEL